MVKDATRLGSTSEGEEERSGYRLPVVRCKKRGVLSIINQVNQALVLITFSFLINLCSIMCPRAEFGRRVKIQYKNHMASPQQQSSTRLLLYIHTFRGGINGLGHYPTTVHIGESPIMILRASAKWQKKFRVSSFQVSRRNQLPSRLFIQP